MLAVVLKYRDPHLSKRLQGREGGPVHSIVPQGIWVILSQVESS